MDLTKKEKEYLDQYFLWKDREDIQKAAYPCLQIQSFLQGETIYTEEKFFNALGIVLSGECTVYNHQTELNHILPGSCFGAAAIFAKEQYVTTIQAKKACKIAFLTSEDLTKLFEAYPAMAVRYIEFLSSRIFFLNQKIDSFTAPSSEEAVMDFLWQHQNEAHVVEIDGGFARLSRELSIGRATLYRVMNKLQEENKIQKEGNQIILLMKERS